MGKSYNYRIFAASSREIIWEGQAINPRHARKQAAALLQRSNIGHDYVTVQENHIEYYQDNVYPYDPDHFVKQWDHNLKVN